MTALLERAPKFALRHEDGDLKQVPIDVLIPGDWVLVRHGKVVSADGTVADGAGAMLDQSALTGEPLPVRLADGAEVMSGATNAGETFDMIVARPAAEIATAQLTRRLNCLWIRARDSAGPLTQRCAPWETAPDPAGLGRYHERSRT